MVRRGFLGFFGSLFLFVVVVALNGASLAELHSLSFEAVKAFENVIPSGDEVVKQMFFTAVVESGGGRWDKQIGGGPAVSYWQIEPVTAEDVYYRYLSTRKSLKDRVEKFSGVSQVEKGQMREVLLKNPKFAACIARLVYGMDKGSIPVSKGWEGHAEYWKKAYQKGGSQGLSAKKALEVFRREAL
jgi:hypothetical protein